MFSFFEGLFGSRENEKVQEEERKKERNKQRIGLIRKGPLRWSPEILAEFLELHSCPEIAKACLELRLDGQSVIEVSPQFLANWMKQSKETNLQGSDIARFQEILSSDIRSDGLVEPFLSGFPLRTAEEEIAPQSKKEEPPTTEDDKLLANWANYEKDRIEASSLSPIQLVQKFHSITSITDEHVPAALSRNWLTQPNACRRYYSAPIDVLPIPDPSSSSLLGDFLYYSLALSGSTDDGAYAMSPHPSCTKRVNPSSGGLHPEEVYILSSAGKGCGGVHLSHYLPKDHALEKRFISSKEISLPENLFVFGVAAVADREQWKYGVRGYRYTQLDVGHVLGSLAVSSSALSRLHPLSKPVEILAFDALSFSKNASDAFGLEEPSNLPQSADEATRSLMSSPTGREYLEMIVAVSCGETPIQEELIANVIEKMAGEVRAGWMNRLGAPNYLFKYNLNPPGLWAWSETLTEAIRGSCCVNSAEEEVEEKQKPSNLVLLASKNCDLFHEWEKSDQLFKTIRSRRSMTNFARLSRFSVRQFGQILAGTLPSQYQTSPSSDIHMCLWVSGVDGLDPGRYFCWRGKEMDGLSDYLSQTWFENHVKLDPVKHADIPSRVHLFRILEEPEQKKEEENENENENEKEKDEEEKKEDKEEEEMKEQKEEKKEEDKEDKESEKEEEEKEEKEKQEVSPEVKIRLESGMQSCEQNIATNACVVFSFVTELPFLLGTDSPSSSSSSSTKELLPKYRHSHWQCGFLGHLIYIYSYLVGAGCSGMGCFCDKRPSLSFKLKEGRGPLYHMAVGTGGELSYPYFNYPKRKIIRSRSEK